MNENDNLNLRLVDFYADWCGPCKVVAKMIDEISGQLTDVVFEKMNVDDDRDSVKTLGITSIPTIILFKNGVEVGRKVGFVFKDVLMDWINDFRN
jgi:thioredoxin 1